MTALDRLLLEAIPTGTFGGARPPRRRGKPAPAPPGPDPNAAAHRRALADAIALPDPPARPDHAQETAA